MEKPSGKYIFFLSPIPNIPFLCPTIPYWVYKSSNLFIYLSKTLPTTSASSLFYSILSDLRWNNIDSFQFPSCFIVMTSEKRILKLTYDLNIRKNGCGKILFCASKYNRKTLLYSLWYGCNCVDNFNEYINEWRKVK